MREGDLACDGQAEAGRPGTASATDVQAHEPVENAAPVFEGDAFTSDALRKLRLAGVTWNMK